MNTAIKPKEITVHGLKKPQRAARKSGNARKRGSEFQTEIMAKAQHEINFDLTGLFKKRIRVKTQDLYVFSNQLSVLINAGLPLVSALRLLGEQIENDGFRAVIEQVGRQVQAGVALSEAFMKFPNVFPNLFISLVQAAEAGGNIAMILQQLAEHLKKKEATNKKIKAATAYPKFVLGFFSVVVAAITLVLVPKFKETFEGFGTELPVPTRIMMDISDFIKDNLMIEIALAAAMVFAFKYFKKTDYGKAVLDRLQLRLPVVGDIVSKSVISRFCGTLGILLQSGVAIVESIEISTKTTENTVFRNAFWEIKRGIVAGETLYAKLSEFPIFPPIVVSMLATGEQSGSLDKMLKNVTEMFDNEIDSRIAKLTSILEPAIMVALGAVALVVILVLYLPIFYLGSVM